MKKQTATLLFSLIAIPSLSATTTFASDSDAIAGATWDFFIADSAVPATVSQGTANSTFGSLIDTSELSTEILIGYDSPPGGIGFNPDTYYLHTGASTWSADLALSGTVTHVRVSYSLFGSTDFGPISAFALAPSMAGATVLDSGRYSYEDGLIFYTNLELGSATDTIATSFGDQLAGFGPAFRSVDAVQVELFTTEPTAIPEPTSGLLVLLGGMLFFRRQR